MGHTYGGGATGEGHRYVDVSKTVTQQTRPRLEREISQAHAARQQKPSPTAAVAAGGLAAAGVGAGMAGSGKRKIKRVNAAVERTGGLVREAADRADSHKANAHQAHLAAGKAGGQLKNAKSRQAALGQWEKTGAKLPHTTRIVSSTGRESPTTVKQVGSREHVKVRNAFNRQAHDAAEGAKRHGETAQAEHARFEQAAADKGRFSELHQRGVQYQGKVVPKMSRRIGAGRTLGIAGAVTAAGALVHGERKRGKIEKGMPLTEIQKAIGPRLFKEGGANATRALLSKPKATELSSRLAAARKPAKLVPTVGQGKAPTVPTPQELRSRLGAPRGTELSRRLGDNARS